MNKEHLKSLSLGALILGLSAITPACQSSTDDAPGKAPTSAVKKAEVKKAEAPKAPKASPEGDAQLKELAANYNGWKTLTEAQLSDKQAVQRKRALESQKTVGGELMKTLSTTIAEAGHVKAISDCNTEAMAIPAAEAKAKGIKIGRTSQRLRNPSNIPPLWAEDAVAMGIKSPIYRVSPQGSLGVLNPIVANEGCMGCHGAAGQLAEGVEAELTKLYPEDKATGYKAGDLRGYFWVEVPHG